MSDEGADREDAMDWIDATYGLYRGVAKEVIPDMHSQSMPYQRVSKTNEQHTLRRR